MCCKKRKIGHELRTLDNMMSRNLMAAARERGVDELTAMHGWILGYLCRNEDKDIFQKDIEAEFKICRSTVTNILKLMEKKGYIKRESVPYDARLKKLVLTDTGRELHEKTKDMIDMLEEQTVEGISKEDLPLVFERFYRTDLSRNRKTGGAGIGLAIVKAIVEAHHGTVTAESREGRGSKFIVILPVGQPN